MNTAYIHPCLDQKLIIGTACTQIIGSTWTSCFPHSDAKDVVQSPSKISRGQDTKCDKDDQIVKKEKSGFDNDSNDFEILPKTTRAFH